MAGSDEDRDRNSLTGEPSGPGAIEGCIDAFDGRRIIGWAYDRTDPKRRLRIVVTAGDAVTSVLADQERRDVAATGRNDGFCGFTAEPYCDLLVESLIHVREATTGTELAGSPIDPIRSVGVVPARDGRIEGVIDFVDCNRIVGWACDRDSHGRRLRIEVAIGEHRIVLTADGFRRDVADAGIGDGYCGFDFNFDIRTAVGRLIHVRECSTGTELAGSPFRADIPNRLADSNNSPALDLLRREVQIALEDSNHWPTLATPNLPQHSGSKLAVLLAPAFPDRDPENLITRYVAFEVARSERQDLVPDGSLLERMKVLRWYLTECGSYHRMPVPLSEGQLAFLNAPMPLIAIETEISIAAYAFITSEKDTAVDLRDPTALCRAMTWWCVERASRIAPGGELITQAQVRVLNAPVEQAGESFRLTTFLRDLHAGESALHPLNLLSDVGRATLAAVVVLRALRLPSLVRLLPQNLVLELLHSTGADRRPLFDELLHIVRRTTRAAAGGDSLGRIGDVARAIFARPAHVSSSPASGVPFLRDPRIADGLEPGVAVIGPLQATSGLGQATRISVDILERAGRVPAQLDFFPGNPAPTGFADRPGLVSLRVPRRINLLHLNAEVVPHAFALLDRRVTERSYNIGYFFWELDTVPDSHRLAFDLLDEIWVSSEYNRDTYAKATGLPVHNVGMTTQACQDVAPVGRGNLNLPADVFVFLATFDSLSFVERKNPLGLLAAFHTAFPILSDERVALVIKTQNRDRIVNPHHLDVWRRIEEIAGRDPRITIIDRTMSYSALIGLKKTCDAYVSLHRSEGWGFGCLEAMSLGMPIIATAYSGNMDFCSPETAFLVDYELVPVLPTDYVYAGRRSRWANPSLASAAQALQTVYLEPALRRSKSAAGQQRAITEFGVEAIARRYAVRLDAIEASLTARQAFSDELHS